jgi:hypothetical protein
MSFKSRLRTIFENTTWPCLYNQLPRGLDLAYGLRMVLPGYSPSTIFEVGANEGKTASWCKQDYLITRQSIPELVLHTLAT